MDVESIVFFTNGNLVSSRKKWNELLKKNQIKSTVTKYNFFKWGQSRLKDRSNRWSAVEVVSREEKAGLERVSCEAGETSKTAETRTENLGFLCSPDIFVGSDKKLPLVVCGRLILLSLLNEETNSNSAGISVSTKYLQPCWELWKRHFLKFYIWFSE